MVSVQCRTVRHDARLVITQTLQETARSLVWNLTLEHHRGKPTVAEVLSMIAVVTRAPSADCRRMEPASSKTFMSVDGAHPGDRGAGGHYAGGPLLILTVGQLSRAL